LAKPLINPNFLSTEFDRLTMRETVKAANRFVAASPWKDYLNGPFGNFTRATNDTSIDTYVAANAGTFFHPVGTAQMSPKDAKYGVTDPDLKVKGVHGLRIIDASILVRTFTLRISSVLISIKALPSKCSPTSSPLPHR
jgi:choline dehydrogenase-like flavoprotein